MHSGGNQTDEGVWWDDRGPVPLQCSCGSTLTVAEMAVACPDCGREWPIDREGVVHFVDSSTQERVVTSVDETPAENDSSRRIDNERNQTSRLAREPWLDPGWEDWTVLGDFHERAVLTLGGGWASLCYPLTFGAASVVHADHDLERVTLTARTAREMGASVVPVHAKPMDLPIDDGGVERIVLNGLLAVVPSQLRASDPTDAQREFLRYLHSRLDANGELYLGAENRYNPKALLSTTYRGSPSWKRLLPTAVREVFGQLSNRVLSGPRLKSKAGYERLLRTAGYRTADVAYTAPHNATPERVHSEYGRLLSYYRESAAPIRENMRVPVPGRAFETATEVLDVAGPDGLLAPGFFIRAEKREWR